MMIRALLRKQLRELGAAFLRSSKTGKARSRASAVGYALLFAVLVVVLMIRFIDAFKVFDTVYVMTNGGPGSATEMLPNYIYKQGLRYFDAGYAAAMAIVFVLVMTLCTLFFLRWRKREEAKL